jgi:HAMP domain-containing protein
MIVACKNCGAKFEITPQHKKRGVTEFTCEFCKSVVAVPREAEEPEKKDLSVSQLPSKKPEGTPPTSGVRSALMGLRTKMFLLFFFVPILLFVIASLYYITHMKTLTDLITKESSQTVTKMAEESIANAARAVAREAKLYLSSHPDLKKEKFNKTPQFINVAMQKVGQTGYTMLVSRATNTEPLAIWVNPEKEMIGIDIAKEMKKKLGTEFERWLKIQSKPYEIGGYYKWLDGRKKYQFTVPIEGTNFNIASTAYLEEFTLPMNHLSARANQMTDRETRNMMIILLSAAVLLALVVAVYSYRLSGRVRHLANAADRISIGNLDMEITGTKSKDEIGELANAFSRMQTSISLAIKRMREKK